jgi:hypothetical protein
MIYNIRPDTFGSLGTRMGDLVAIVNIVQYLRKEWEDPELQFYFYPGSINREDYIHKFLMFLTRATDCFSLAHGEKYLPWKNVGVWDYRDISGDHVKISNFYAPEKKVVVFPLYDAEYNVQRNWSIEALYKILEECNALYPEHRKVICAKDKPPADIDVHEFEISTDFMTNIHHLMTSEVFYGGDTGVSHLASAIQPGPKVLNYVYGSHCMIHTLPFYYVSENRGNLRTFWLDFTGATWQ